MGYIDEDDFMNFSSTVDLFFMMKQCRVGIES